MNAFLLNGRFFDLVKNKKICFDYLDVMLKRVQQDWVDIVLGEVLENFIWKALFIYSILFFISRNLELITYYSELKKHSYNPLEGIISFYCKE